MNDFFCSLVVNLLAGVIIFIVGIFWPIIPRLKNVYILKRFFGKDIINSNISIVYGALKDSRFYVNKTVCNPDIFKFRAAKIYKTREPILLQGPTGNIVGECEIRSSSYLINTLSNYRKKPVNIISDTEALSNEKQTIISLGSSSSNELSDYIFHLENNKYFGFTESGDAIKNLKTGNLIKGFQEPEKFDYGIILKLINKASPEHFYMVCAGLGEYGTSGAAWFLSTNFKDYRNYPEFGLVVKVKPGLDISAKLFELVT